MDFNNTKENESCEIHSLAWEGTKKDSYHPDDPYLVIEEDYWENFALDNLDEWPDDFDYDMQYSVTEEEILEKLKNNPNLAPEHVERLGTLIWQ